MASAISTVFSDAWDTHSSEVRITKRSRPWWDDDCARAFSQYQDSKSPDDWNLFRKATKAAKRKFFDERIEEIATSNKRPWDLMEWVKQRKLPPFEAIQYNGEPCHDMADLWDALHNTYNSASDREADVSVLDPLPDMPTREWTSFSMKEMLEALDGCSNNSSPGPDHIKWSHLKKIVKDSECRDVFLALANACLRVGCWPKHFKELLSVIIPKPGKPDGDLA